MGWTCSHLRVIDKKVWVALFFLACMLKFISSKIQFACLCIKIRGTWLELEIIILSEVSQTDKGNYFEEKEQSSRVKMI